MVNIIPTIEDFREVGCAEMLQPAEYGHNIRLITASVPLNIMVRFLRNKYKLGEFVDHASGVFTFRNTK